MHTSRNHNSWKLNIIFYRLKTGTEIFSFSFYDLFMITISWYDFYFNTKHPKQIIAFFKIYLYAINPKLEQIYYIRNSFKLKIMLWSWISFNLFFRNNLRQDFISTWRHDLPLTWISHTLETTIYLKASWTQTGSKFLGNYTQTIKQTTGRINGFCMGDWYIWCTTRDDEVKVLGPISKWLTIKLILKQVLYKEKNKT